MALQPLSQSSVLPQILFFERGWKDSLLDPLRWSGRHWRTFFDLEEGCVAYKTVQIGLRIIPGILLVIATVGSVLPGIVGSWLKVRDEDHNCVDSCIIADVSQNAMAFYNRCRDLQIPPTWQREEAGYDEIRPQRKQYHGSQAVDNIVNSLRKAGLEDCFVAIKQDLCREGQVFEFTVNFSFFQHFFYHLANCFQKTSTRRVMDTGSDKFSMIATSEENARWEDVRDLLVGAEQSADRRDKSLDMIRLSCRIELRISDDLKKVTFHAYGAI